MQIPEKLSYDFLGGDRTDYSELTNPEKEWSAEQLNTTLCAVAMMSRTVTQARVKVTCGVTPVVNEYEAVWKKNSPIVPTVEHVSTGVYTITFQSTVLDERMESHPVVLKFASAQIAGNGVGVTEVSASLNVVTISVRNLSGTLSDLSNVILCVEAS